MKYDKAIEMADATIYIAQAKSYEDLDVQKVKAWLEDGRQQCYKIIAEECNKEIESMNRIAEYINH